MSNASLEDRLAAAERAAASLDPDGVARAAIRDPVLAYAEWFLDELPQLPAYRVTEDKGRAIRDVQFSEEGRPVEDVLELIAEHVDGPGLNPASGGHLAYVPGGGLYASSLADYLSAVTNRYAGVFFSSPGAVRVEHQVSRWTADLVGFPGTAGGTLTSGGSIANLACLAAARDSRGLKAREFERAVVYLSSQTHHCVAKAIRVLGMSECVKRYVPLDEHFRMRPDALEAQVEADRRDGLNPWVVVASAGTTDVGALDPLAAIADIAGRQGLWYHVDAAYGGFFLLLPAMRERFRGIERADSAVLDPHKGLFLPYGLGVALVRDADTLLAAFKSDAPYLQDTHLERDELSPADLSPELTRHFRGLRLWLPLLVHGIAPFRAALEEKLLLATWLGSELGRLGWETGPAPDLSIITYRWAPPGASPADVDRINARIVDLVKRDGRVFVSSTTIDGRYMIRFAGLTHRTHLSTVRTLVDVLRQSARVAERELLAPQTPDMVRSTA
ncbi:MAG TPA: pyridoxal-dependent decarboxylase [Gemmatimonadales bacterium]|nr:pyridoxal-dependent decarboxylase [Gemmatimonadales bacterium]